MNATLVATAQVRRNLAVQHMIAASRLSRAVGEIEKSNAGQPFGAFFEEMIGNANACILLTVAALEAYANELFLSPQRFRGHPEEFIQELWPVVEKGEILSKFQVALPLLGGKPMPKGDKPFQNAALLIALRNAITHFKPEWSHEDAEHAKLSAKLKSQLDPGNPWFQEEHLFPLRWVTYTNTSWALRSGIEFIVAFEQAAGLVPTQHYSRLLPP